MSNGAANCALEVCCDPGSVAQREALISEVMHGMHDGTGCTREVAEPIVDFLNANFDLAPRGTLRDFKAAIAKLALTRVADEP